MIQLHYIMLLNSRPTCNYFFVKDLTKKEKNDLDESIVEKILKLVMPKTEEPWTECVLLSCDVTATVCLLSVHKMLSLALFY